MSAYELPIDVQAKSIARPLLALSGASMPDFVIGDKRTVRLYFQQTTGAYADFSGDLTYSVALAIGNVGAIPTSGTFTLTYGADTTSGINFDATASDVQTALNALASITSAGGVTVTGTTAGFRVIFNNVGARTAITGSGEQLNPASSVFAMNAEPGDGSTRSIQLLRIRQSVIAYQDTWSQVLNPDDGVTPIGYEAIIDTNTVEAALALGNNASTNVLELEIQVTDPSGNVTTYAQTPITLKNDVIDPSTLTTVNLPTYLTATEIANAYLAQANFLSEFDTTTKKEQSKENINLVGFYGVTGALDYSRLIAGAVWDDPLGTHVASKTNWFESGVTQNGYFVRTNSVTETIGQPLNTPLDLVVIDASKIDVKGLYFTNVGNNGIQFTGTGAADTRTNLSLVVGTDVQAYSANLSAIPKSNYNASAAPAVTDDSGSGYSVGSNWYDTTNDDAYVCLDASAGAAVWKKTTP